MKSFCHSGLLENFFLHFGIQDISIFSFQISSVFLPLCISSLLEESVEETEEPLNFVAKQFITVGTYDKKQDSVMGMDEGESLSNKDEEAEKQGKEDDENIALGDDGGEVSDCFGIAQLETSLKKTSKFKFFSGFIDSY